MKKEKHYHKAVVIGRFNPVMHNGHISLVRKALEVADKVYIIIGSANKFPDVKNPLDLNTRYFMVNSVLLEEFTKEDRQRVVVTHANDYKYNDERWKTEIRYVVKEKPKDKITMVGYEKDEDSYWLHQFGWVHTEVEPYMVNFYGKCVSMSSTFIRDGWLRDDSILLRSEIPHVCEKVLYDFTYNDDGEKREEYLRLNEERLMWDKELKKFENYPYPSALNCCTADAVVLCNNHILLIERKFAPGKGAWALPGGHKESNETFRYCALRELEEEVKLKVPSKVIRGSIRDSQLFDDPNRSAVFSKPTIALFIVLEPNADGSLPKVKADSDAKSAKWVPLHEIMMNPIMFDDHRCIITHFTGI